VQHFTADRQTLNH